MDGSIPQQRPEQAPARAARLERERAIIAQGEADIAAGLGVEFEDIEAWFVELETNENAPMPGPAGSLPVPGTR